MSSGKNKPMSRTTVTTPLSTAETRDSWLPMIVIAMGQALMSFNVAALPVSIGGMVASFNTPPTTVGTAIIMYSMGVSGFVLPRSELTTLLAIAIRELRDRALARRRSDTNAVPSSLGFGGFV
jgi:hypothetical protein